MLEDSCICSMPIVLVVGGAQIGDVCPQWCVRVCKRGYVGIFPSFAACNGALMLVEIKNFVRVFISVCFPCKGCVQEKFLLGRVALARGSSVSSLFAPFPTPLTKFPL